MKKQIEGHKLEGKQIKHIPTGEVYGIESVWILSSEYGTHLTLLTWQPVGNGRSHGQVAWEDISLLDNHKLGQAYKEIIKRNKNEYKII